MLRVLLIIFSMILIHGCGSSGEGNSDDNASTIDVVDRDVQYLDSYWLPGGRNYAVHENSLAISHNAGVSLLDINESGLVESEIQVSSTGSINIATLENGDIATLMVNHVRVNRIESDMFDVIYMTEDSPDLSAVILSSSMNILRQISSMDLISSCVMTRYFLQVLLLSGRWAFLSTDFPSQNFFMKQSTQQVRTEQTELRFTIKAYSSPTITSFMHTTSTATTLQKYIELTLRKLLKLSLCIRTF